MRSVLPQPLPLETARTRVRRLVSRNHLPRLTGYFPHEYQLLESLSGLGFVAGHELYAAGPYPHSWIGPTARGYLLLPMLRDEIELSMSLLGVKTLSELSNDLLVWV